MSQLSSLSFTSSIDSSLLVRDVAGSYRPAEPAEVLQAALRVLEGQLRGTEMLSLLAAVRIRCYSAVRARFAAEPVAGTNSGKRLADPDAEAAASPAAASERLVRVQ